MVAFYNFIFKYFSLIDLASSTWSKDTDFKRRKALFKHRKRHSNRALFIIKSKVSSLTISVAASCGTQYLFCSVLFCSVLFCSYWFFLKILKKASILPYILNNNLKSHNILE